MHTKHTKHVSCLLIVGMFSIGLMGCETMDDESPDDFLEFSNTDDPSGTMKLGVQTPEELLVWGDVRLVSGEEAPFGNGEYDVVTLSDSIPRELLERVRSAANTYPGVVLYSVDEGRTTQYVAAVPHVENESTFGDEMFDLLNGNTVYNTGCIRLHTGYWWLGAQFTVCDSYGTGLRTFSNLGSYGYDNCASSVYFESNIGELDIYDGVNFSSFLTGFTFDKGVFNAPYNNKASSLKGYF